MLSTLSRCLRPSLLMLLWMTVLTGLVYPLAITGLAQAVFPWQARGSLVERSGARVGSALIGQAFAQPRHFQGRPSATVPTPYNAAASMGSNQGPTSPALIEAITARVEALKPLQAAQPAPMDLVTASGSGLDPHITPEAARYQAAAVARARGVDEKTVQDLIDRHTEGRLWGFWGQPRVNVLQLNLALDKFRAKE